MATTQFYAPPGRATEALLKFASRPVEATLSVKDAENDDSALRKWRANRRRTLRKKLREMEASEKQSERRQGNATDRRFRQQYTARMKAEAELANLEAIHACECSVHGKTMKNYEVSTTGSGFTAVRQCGSTLEEPPSPISNSDLSESVSTCAGLSTSDFSRNSTQCPDSSETSEETAGGEAEASPPKPPPARTTLNYPQQTCQPEAPAPQMVSSVMRPPVPQLPPPQAPFLLGRFSNGAHSAAAPVAPTYTTVNVTVERQSVAFMVPNYMKFMQGIGSGSYGAVASFADSRTGESVAVKKVTDVFHNAVDALRTVRELQILRQVRHDNIIRMESVYLTCNVAGKQELYIVQQLMYTDLQCVVRSKAVLKDAHHRWYIYCVLRAVAYLHSLDIVHRDVKPANVLLSREHDVKLCDFNLSRNTNLCRDYENEDDGLEPTDGDLSSYVCSRWWRAPEIMLYRSRYGTPIDIWSTGVMLCELMTRHSLLPGKSSKDQMMRIIAAIGLPKDEDIEWQYGRTWALQVLRSAKAEELPGSRAPPLANVAAVASNKAMSMIFNMLCWDVRQRATAKECICHEYLEEFQCNYVEAPREQAAGMDWSFEERCQTDVPGEFCLDATKRALFETCAMCPGPVMWF